MNAKIYVATHKRDNCLLKLKNPMYIPIHCGKAIYKDEPAYKGYLPEFGDDTGDNISAKNPNYCELTALYWIWRNDNSDPDDIVGLNHYRRYFSEPNNNMPISKNSIIDLLWRGDYDFIVNGCGTERDDTKSDEESAYVGYKRNHTIADLELALEGTEKMFPELFPRLDHEVRHSGAMCLCNMMITRKKYLDEYCSYLFPVLQYVESHIDLNDDNHQGYGARVFGFLGERLFRPWLMASGHTGRQGPSLDWERYSGYVWR